MSDHLLKKMMTEATGSIPEAANVHFGLAADGNRVSVFLENEEIYAWAPISWNDWQRSVGYIASQKEKLEMEKAVQEAMNIK